MPLELKAKPFKPFMKYLEGGRAAIIRVAGPSLGARSRRTTMARSRRERHPVPFMGMRLIKLLSAGPLKVRVLRINMKS